AGEAAASARLIATQWESSAPVMGLSCTLATAAGEAWPPQPGNAVAATSEHAMSAVAPASRATRWRRHLAARSAACTRTHMRPRLDEPGGRVGHDAFRPFEGDGAEHAANVL